MEEINSSNFTVIQTRDGILQSQDGIYIQSKKDGSIYLVPPSPEIMTWVENDVNFQGSSLPQTKGIEMPSDEPNKRMKWTKEGILKLIELRIKYDVEFKSTTSKNEVTWKKIADELRNESLNMSATQCNDKWRYLKGRYTAKIDNMGDKGTGESPYDFPYFEEMDKFLGQKHNVKPPAIASSVRGDSNTNTLEKDVTEKDDSNSSDISEPPRKKKISNITCIKKNKTGLQVLMEHMKESSKQRELSRQRRHEEQLTVRDNAVKVFSEKMDALINTLKK